MKSTLILVATLVLISACTRPAPVAGSSQGESDFMQEKSDLLHGEVLVTLDCFTIPRERISGDPGQQRGPLCQQPAAIRGGIVRNDLVCRPPKKQYLAQPYYNKSLRRRLVVWSHRIYWPWRNLWFWIA